MFINMYMHIDFPDVSSVRIIMYSMNTYVKYSQVLLSGIILVIVSSWHANQV